MIQWWDVRNDYHIDNFVEQSLNSRTSTLAQNNTTFTRGSQLQFREQINDRPSTTATQLRPTFPNHLHNTSTSTSRATPTTRLKMQRHRSFSPNDLSEPSLQLSWPTLAYILGHLSGVSHALQPRGGDQQRQETRSSVPAPPFLSTAKTHTGIFSPAHDNAASLGSHLPMASSNSTFKPHLVNSAPHFISLDVVTDVTLASAKAFSSRPTRRTHQETRTSTSRTDTCLSQEISNLDRVANIDNLAETQRTPLTIKTMIPPIRRFGARPMAPSDETLCQTERSSTVAPPTTPPQLTARKLEFKPITLEPPIENINGTAVSTPFYTAVSSPAMTRNLIDKKPEFGDITASVTTKLLKFENRESGQTEGPNVEMDTPCSSRAINNLNSSSFSSSLTYSSQETVNEAPLNFTTSSINISTLSIHQNSNQDLLDQATSIQTSNTNPPRLTIPLKSIRATTTVINPQYIQITKSGIVIHRPVTAAYRTLTKRQTNQTSGVETIVHIPIISKRIKPAPTIINSINPPPTASAPAPPPPKATTRNFSFALFSAEILSHDGNGSSERRVLSPTSAWKSLLSKFGWGLSSSWTKICVEVAKGLR
ncbi:hypothetical protein HDU76_006069, partial [Blyttiomyces sp. JEL0837]